MSRDNAAVRLDEEDVFRTKKKQAEVYDFGIFAAAAAPAPPPPAMPPRVVHWTERYADLAANSRDFETIRAKAEAAMRGILNAFKSASVWEVRLALSAIGAIKNDGTEKLDGLGGLAEGMGLVAVDTERPPQWAREALKASHGNRNSVWMRPADVMHYDRTARRRRLAQEHPEQ